MVHAREAVDQRKAPGTVRVPAPTFQEADRAAWFLEQFRALGWEASIDRVGNAIAASGDGPYVALTAHLDTVIPARSKDEIEVDADGRFRGPGVCDNGAGLAALLGFARAWKSGPRLPEFALSPLLVANVGEEGEGNLLGMRYLCKQSGWRGASRRSWWQMAPTPITSPAGHWAAGASRPCSTARAAIAGAILALAIRCMRCAGR